MSDTSNENKIVMFCAHEQAEVEHTLDIADNGEIILTCDTCERMIKLPAGTDAAGIKAYIAAHAEANIGQKTKESIEASKAKLLKDLMSKGK